LRRAGHAGKGRTGRTLTLLAASDRRAPRAVCGLRTKEQSRRCPPRIVMTLEETVASPEGELGQALVAALEVHPRWRRPRHPESPRGRPTGRALALGTTKPEQVAPVTVTQVGASQRGRTDQVQVLRAPVGGRFDANECAMFPSIACERVAHHACRRAHLQHVGLRSRRAASSTGPATAPDANRPRARHVQSRHSPRSAGKSPTARRRGARRSRPAP